MFWNSSSLPTDAQLAALGYAELKELRDRIERYMSQQFAEAQETFRADFLAKMELYGLTLDDLKPKRRKRSVFPKYRNPENPDETWSGLGKPKRWLQEKLDQGHSLEEFLIRDEGATT